MPYVQATLLELHRFASIVPLNVVHVAERDTEFLGYKIKKDTFVVTNLYAMHHDEKFWERPECFIPERFLDDSGQMLALDHPRVRHVMAFGAGIRMCIGENLAAVRLFIWMVTIVQRFEIKPESDHPNVPCHSSYYTGDFTFKHPPYKARFFPRLH